MMSYEALEKNQKVRASVQRDVQAMCTEACHFLGLDITKPAMDLLLDVFYHKMTTYADDLEKFAKHAKRSVITGDDCKLLTRRNQALTAHINTLKLPSSNKEPAKRRRTVASAASSPKRARIENMPRTSESILRPVNVTRATENVTRAPENVTRALDIVTRAPENAPRAHENVTQASANVTRAAENISRAVTSAFATEEPVESDVDTIDLTFD